MPSVALPVEPPRLPTGSNESALREELAQLMTRSDGLIEEHEILRRRIQEVLRRLGIPHEPSIHEK
jgi:hypothetical protein